MEQRLSEVAFDIALEYTRSLPDMTVFGPEEVAALVREHGASMTDEERHEFTRGLWDGSKAAWTIGPQPRRTEEH